MNEKPRLEELKAPDRVDGYPAQTPKWLRRTLEIVPGFLVWLLVLSPILLGLFGLERIFVFYVSFLIIYWMYRGVKFVIGIAIGVSRMKRDLNTDFVAKIKEGNKEGFDELSYIYLCPVYKEGLDVLEPSFEAWSKSDVGADKIHVVVAMEERTADDIQIPNFKILKEKYGDKFASMQYYVHPKDIEGEATGVKGANINWATRKFVQKLESEGKDISKYLLITCDCDLRPDPKYLSAITYKYLTVENPEKRYYTSAVYTLNNNIWRVPTLIRVQSSMLTLVILHTWVTEKYEHMPFVKNVLSAKETFSSYVVNLKTLKEVHYWDPQLGIDDSTFFWNALIRFKGEFQGEEVYIPTHSDAVENESTIKSYKSFYKQQHRWGWGVIIFPTTLASLIYEKSIPVYKKIFIFFAMYRTYIFFTTVVYLMTFGLNLLGLISKDYLFSSASYNLPNAMSFLLTTLLICNVFIVYYRRKITPIPSDWKWWRHLIDFGEVALIAVQMLSFGFIPYLQADTEMMLGRGFKKNFYATDKVQMKK
ncbi:hypothetical protein CVU76_03615 [Candidatus Dojkabacteria bacterium HGW-Dojkabacteria-1]|uniref:Glycosyltransferase 2-like domain-containing protein n=1 Tax=Candidatus Dojkabacteria bacterium HGW-Dojkabacteria-1 TaxID=2013761 RepID=A0A2N2F4E9_9BACT|nr:MAG: hypothetical protein CVU76_03615 [Candidatus Dojkabacteria bacterium HGW-Dojkabacteria-1]